MKHYLIYTAEGFAVPPNEDEEVDNCQVLGRAEGESLSDAIDNLFRENTWIEKCGFSKLECMGVQIVNE